MNIKNDDTQIRKSNIELLRILAMFFIIAHHISVHSGFNFLAISNYANADDIWLFINSIWIKLLEIGGKVGTDIFFMISGYFLIDKEYKSSKLLKLFFQTMFYALLLYLIMQYKDCFRDEIILNIVTPARNWWFISTYLSLYMLHPYINALLNKLSKKQYLGFLLTLFIVSSLRYTIGLTTSNFNPSVISIYVFLYSIGGYVNKYYSNDYSIKKYIVINVLTLLATLLFSLVEPVLGQHISYSSFFKPYFTNDSSLFTILLSITLFLTFLKIDINSKLINNISRTTYGVYLIHDNVDIRLFLWIKLFKNVEYSSSSLLIPYTLFQIIVVFAVCSIIDYLRIILFEKKISNMSDRIGRQIDIKVEKIIQRLV